MTAKAVKMRHWMFVMGTYECECIEGYNKTFVADIAGPTTCKVNGPRPWLLLANENDIRKFEVDTWFEETLLCGLLSAVSVDFYKDQYVYWSDVSMQQIARSEIKNGIMSKKQVILNRDIDTPDGIAIDWIYDHLYWTDTGPNTIHVSNLEGGKNATITDNDLVEPRGIALDPIHGYFYMTDWGKNPKIERIGIDGSDRNIITKDVVWPNAITIDYIDSRIFWIDAKLHTIMSADLVGSQTRTVLHNTQQINHPFSMTVFEDNIFWTDWSEGDIRTANKHTGKHFQRKVIGLNSPTGIKVYHESIQRSGHNVCNDTEVGCEYLCLPKPRVESDDPIIPSYTCVCPDNKKISHNGHTCIPKDMNTDYPSTVMTTMTTPERTVTRDNNIVTTQSSAESQPISMKTLRSDEIIIVDCSTSVVSFANSDFFQVLPIKTSLFIFHQQKEMGKVCTDSVECQDNYDCINSRCSCKRSTYWNGISCARKLPSECEDISSDKDGVYLVYPKVKMTSRKIFVYCIMSGNKKWTVIQKKTDESVDFYRTWSEYSNGFRRVYRDHWLGHYFFIKSFKNTTTKRNIYRLSQDGTHELSIVLVDWEGNLMEANYSQFSVNSEEDNYSLSVSGYSGNAGDGMDYHNSKSFYTKDRDNRNGCAVNRHGGWWYDNCYQANLNGRYNGTINESGKYTGLVWFEWKSDYSLKATLMMIRRKE
ncbi:VLDLR [Mytilus coruscus]|uniref:VLDLR n=1 Tax=Mytilus coruscus TaxID=42192 RepID=A0A6J8ACU6_MYTCO|nr:VLDLR [Mytilus coruscus]